MSLSTFEYLLDEAAYLEQLMCPTADQLARLQLIRDLLADEEVTLS